MKTEEQRLKYFNKLIEVSENEKYDPVKLFNWEEEISSDQLWMSPELLSIYDTPFLDGLTDSQLKRLSKWELINFFSMSVHGERNIKMDMLKYLNTKYFKKESDYFIHFLGEENSHIYFFSRFCNQYANKLYRYTTIPIKSFSSYELARYIVFAQTLIAEEIGDYFNVLMSKDDRLPSLVRMINKQHHLDESRHIGMGKILCKGMWHELLETQSTEQIELSQEYLINFIYNFLKDFYNPEIYIDSGIENGYELREYLMQSESRKEVHKKACKKLIKYLVKNQMINKELYD